MILRGDKNVRNKSRNFYFNILRFFSTAQTLMKFQIYCLVWSSRSVSPYSYFFLLKIITFIRSPFILNQSCTIIMDSTLDYFHSRTKLFEVIFMWAYIVFVFCLSKWSLEFNSEDNISRNSFELFSL